MTIRMTKLVARLGLVAIVASAAACLPIQTENMAPTAVVNATIGGKPVRIVANTVKSSLLEIKPATAGSVTLDGSQSVDPEGERLTLVWWNTGTPRETRFPTTPPVAGAPGAPVDMSKIPTAPDGTGPTFTVTIPATAGTYIYSLYASDTSGNVSIPATVRFVVP